MPEHDDENFLLRWSRRKRDAGRGSDVAGAEREVLPGVDRPAPDAAGGVDPLEGRADAGAAAHDPVPGDVAGSGAETVPDDLVDVEVEALDYEADFTRFMKEDVPEALRKRALRQLWRSDPILANVDGLNDYDDDFTDAALAVKVLETAHKIRAEAEDGDGAGEPHAGEGDAATPDSDDEALARVDGSEPGAEGKGEGEVTRTG
jgi:hypothetical protein